MRIHPYYIDQHRKAIGQARDQAEFLKRSCTLAGEQQAEGFARMDQRLQEAAQGAAYELDRLTHWERPVTNFDVDGPPAIRAIGKGELIDGEVLTNTYLRGHLSHEAKIRNTEIHNGALSLFTSRGCRVENVRVIGGARHHECNGGINISACEDLTVRNIETYDTQRGLNISINVSGTSRNVLIDGVIIDGHHDWIGVPSQNEAAVIHWYTGMKPGAYVSAVIRNVHVLNWRDNSGAAFTFWDAPGKDLLLHDSTFRGPIQFGLSPSARYENVEIKDIDQAGPNPDKSLINLMYYKHESQIVDAIQSIDAPGYRFRIKNRLPRNNNEWYEEGIFDTAAEAADWIRWRAAQ